MDHKKPLTLLLVIGMSLSAAAGCSSSGSSESVIEDGTSSGTAQTVSQEPEGSQDSPGAVESIADIKPEFEASDAPIYHDEDPAVSFEKVSQQYSENSKDIMAALDKIAAKKDIPCINITTEDKKTINSKGKYIPSVIDVFNCDESYILSANGGVKVRGNSTAKQGDEKPYRIKFEEKQNMLGLHGGKQYKSWVLLRSYWNLAPDYTALSLAKTIFGGKYYSSDFMYVNLFINGKSRGIYLLCEQNQAASGRIDVTEPGKDDTDYLTGYLVEMDNYAGDEHPFFTLDHEGAKFTDISGGKREFSSHDYSIKSDINTQGQLDFIKQYMQSAYRILYYAAEYDKPFMLDSQFKAVPADGRYATAQEAVEAVFDTESLANMLILQELVHNYDVGAGSFYIAVDFTPGSKYPRLTFTAPWDFNWAYEGSPGGRYYACTFQDIIGDQDRSNPWYITAMKTDWFQKLVKEKWAELSRSGVLTDTVTQVVKDCQELKNDLGEDSWKIDKAKDIAAFVIGRIKWLDKQWLG